MQIKAECESETSATLTELWVWLHRNDLSKKRSRNNSPHLNLTLLLYDYGHLSRQSEVKWLFFFFLPIDRTRLNIFILGWKIMSIVLMEWRQKIWFYLCKRKREPILERLWRISNKTQVAASPKEWRVSLLCNGIVNKNRHSEEAWKQRIQNFLTEKSILLSGSPPTLTIH